MANMLGFQWGSQNGGNTAANPAQPEVVPVQLDVSGDTVELSPQYLHLLCPQLLPRPINQALVLLEAWISPAGRRPILARLAVDSGCELEGCSGCSARNLSRNGIWTQSPPYSLFGRLRVSVSQGCVIS